MTIKVSKFLAYVLRHHPEKAGLVPDAQGWVSTDDLLVAIREKFGPFTLEQLQSVVQDGEKVRYAFNDAGDKIRASQGHSTKIDLGLEPVAPPEFLFHGTKDNVLEAIMREGLTPRSRQHVHLSKDIETANVVAARRSGRSVILRVRTAELADHPFYLSDNGVWLTDAVPASALEVYEGN